MSLSPLALGAETILVVDDEPFVLSCVTGVLRHAGFTVLSAASPDEALRISLAHPGAIDLIVCDVVMPGLPGPALVEEFLVLHPEAQCLFIAGLPDHPDVQRQILERGRSFLPKPFFPRDLLAKVRGILHGAPPKVLAAGA